MPLQQEAVRSRGADLLSGGQVSSDPQVRSSVALLTRTPPALTDDAGRLEFDRVPARCFSWIGRPMKKCGRCSKPAVLHITEIRDGDVQALHLCESCAKDYLSHSPADSPSDSPPTSEQSKAQSLAQIPDEADEQVCPNCGITFKEFRAQGRLGCAHDYVAFQEELLPLLENIHGEVQHVGKVPKRAPDASQRQFRLVKLRSRLRAAVEAELYEEAARLRDEIARTEGESGLQGNEEGA